MDLTFPDPDLAFNEVSGHWEFGDIDWSEFKRVLAGNGPCYCQRLRDRVEAYDASGWVREAVPAHADKRRAQIQAAHVAAE